jgi:chromosome segregation ATPase
MGYSSDNYGEKGHFSQLSKCGLERRSGETMKQTWILTGMVVLGFALALTGCNRNEMASLKATLEQTESERDDLKAQMSAVTKSRDQLRKQVDELGGSRTQLQEQLAELRTSREELQTSREELQAQVDGVNKSRIALEKQVAELTKSRDAALVEARSAKNRIDAMATQLDGETQKVRVLEDQLKLVQTAIADLQKKFSL